MRPTREVATTNGQTYFVTSNTAERKPLFRHERWAELFIKVLYGYRPERFLLHGFVVMPDHFHVLITPHESLEKAVQFIKGGFSFWARKEFVWKGDIWVAGFSDHRIRDDEDFDVHERYIAKNAVKARLVEREDEYAYCSANGRFHLDAFPRGLKPEFVAGAGGAAEAAPFQSRRDDGASAGESGASAGESGASAGESGASAGESGASAGEHGASAGEHGASAGENGARAGENDARESGYFHSMAIDAAKECEK